MYRIFSLFAYSRLIHFDGSQQTVTIHVKAFWQWKQVDSIRFCDIEYIDFAFRQIPGAIGFTPGHNAFSTGLTDALDEYRVFLMTTRKRRRVDLFKFWGDGAVHTGFASAVLGTDTLVDAEGRQFEKSYQFIRLIADITGARIGVPALAGIAPNEYGQKVICRKCGHQLNVDVKKCVYCGCNQIETRHDSQLEEAAMREMDSTP